MTLFVYCVCCCGLAMGPSGEVARTLVSPGTPDSQLQAAFARFGLLSVPQRLERLELALSIRPTGGRAGYENFIRNLAYYGAHSRNRGEVNRERVFQDLRRLLEIDDVQVISALAPLLGGEDRELARFIELQVIRPPPGVKQLELNVMAGYVTDDPTNAPPILIDQMLLVDPERALTALARIFGCKPEEVRELIWTSHAIGEAEWRASFEFLKPGDLEAALEQLDRMSRSHQWWVRLYVSRKLVANEAFRRPDLIERLSSDANERVRLAAKEAASPRTKDSGSGWPAPRE
jgi:hypothetical protein